MMTKNDSMFYLHHNMWHFCWKGTLQQHKNLTSSNFCGNDNDGREPSNQDQGAVFWGDVDTDTATKDDNSDEEQSFYYKMSLYNLYVLDSVKDEHDNSNKYKTFMPISKKKEPAFSSLSNDDANVMTIDTVSKSKDITNKLFDAIAFELSLLLKEQGFNSNSCNDYNG
eukprot:9859979-Ditylum_brightwellii.AAC.1